MLAVLALLLMVCAGCKSESSSPTSPGTSTQPPTSTSGGTTPPVNPTVVVTVSNANPVTNSTSVITATVTVNGQPVPNGTAVEFATTDPGSFTESGTAALLRTTTNGVATATLTATAAGTVPVSVTVNNVTKTVTVKFSDQVVIQPPNTTMTVTGLSPTSGKPQGGDQVTITGTNFKSPAHVRFDTGTGTPKDAFVVSVTPTQIVVITPAVDLGPSTQTLPATVTVISSAGNPDEQRAVSPVKFTYALQVLTPSITTVTPNSGPIDGGTRVTIVGEAFQQPVQVLFGAAEAQVISINFNQIIAISPVGSATAPGGSGAVTGFVDVTVVNINSNKRATLTNAFRYVPKMQITAAGPNIGPVTGGTRISIDGIGFNDPVTVVVAGVAAQVIKVSGSQVIAITNPILLTSCADVTGPIVVGNIDNGDQATGPAFTYHVLKPAILSVASPASVGGTTTITVLNPGSVPNFTIGGQPAPIVGAHDNGDGSTTFTLTVPPGLTLSTAACAGAAGANGQIPTSFPIIFTDLSTGCTPTAAPPTVTVLPTVPILAFSPAGGFLPFSATAAVPPSGSNPGSPAVPAPPQTLLVVNGGGGTLMVTSVTPNGCGTNFTVNTPTLPGSLTSCQNFPISVTYNLTSPSGTTSQCSITVATSAGSQTFSLTGSVK
jgi:hypothetical protein